MIEEKSSYILDNQYNEIKITNIPIFPENPQAFLRNHKNY